MKEASFSWDVYHCILVLSLLCVFIRSYIPFTLKFIMYVLACCYFLEIFFSCCKISFIFISRCLLQRWFSELKPWTLLCHSFAFFPGGKTLNRDLEALYGGYEFLHCLPILQQLEFFFCLFLKDDFAECNILSGRYLNRWEHCRRSLLSLGPGTSLFLLDRWCGYFLWLFLGLFSCLGLLAVWIGSQQEDFSSSSTFKVIALSLIGPRIF